MLFMSTYFILLGLLLIVLSAFERLLSKSQALIAGLSISPHVSASFAASLWKLSRGCMSVHDGSAGFLGVSGSCLFASLVRSDVMGALLHLRG